MLDQWLVFMFVDMPPYDPRKGFRHHIQHPDDRTISVRRCSYSETMYNFTAAQGAFSANSRSVLRSVDAQALLMWYSTVRFRSPK